MSKYEKVHFDKWQELAKAVIDGEEIYWRAYGDRYHKILVNESGFNIVLRVDDLYIKKEPTLEELIAIKPRLCWVWEESAHKKGIKLVDKYNYKYIMASYFYEILTDEEIRQFLNGE